MEEDGETTPFWLQNNNSSFRHHRGRRGPSLSSVCFNSGVLIVVLPVVGLLLVIFVIPSLVSFTSQVVQPNLVKKSWNNLNLLLVLFAILCGIFGRKNGEDDDDRTSPNAAQAPEQQQEQEAQPNRHQWFGYSEVPSTRDSFASDSNTVKRGLRSSSSYPDLRQESLWQNETWRFSDDSGLYNNRSGSANFNYGYQNSVRVDDEDSGIKTIPVDTRSTNRSYSGQPPPSPPPAPSPPMKEKEKISQSVPHEYEEMKEIRAIPQSSTPPPPPPPPTKKQKSRQVRRVSQSVPKKKEDEIRPMPEPQSQTPPPPPPPPPEKTTNTEQQKSHRKHERKKSNGAKELASTLASFYKKRKRKNKQRSKENYDDILESISLTFQESPPQTPAEPPAPPAPPSPPPSSVFYQLFKKGSKSKRIHSLSPSVTTPPPPPPPPPPPRSSKRTSQPSPPPVVERQRRKPMTPRRPPLPTRVTNFYDGDEYLNSGNQSPLIPMPPPPPPPPFRMPEFKYVVKGDFVRLKSRHSSRSTSPDLDSVDSPLTPSSPQINGGEAGVSVFCPSPDVDTKADTFIARFRAGLKLEKANSMKQKQEMGVSGPSPRPGSSLRPS